MPVPVREEDAALPEVSRRRVRRSVFVPGARKVPVVGLARARSAGRGMDAFVELPLRMVPGASAQGAGSTFPASSLFWWFFEYLNRYVWNWYYLGVSDLGAVEYIVYASVCFASVLPGVCAVAAWLHTFPIFDDRVYSGMARVNLRKPGWCVFLAVLAATGLVGIVLAPEFAFPLLWMSPVAVFLLVQFLMREPCVLDSVVDGNWSVFIRFSLAALVCGLCWETCNYYALAKWVYSVPWVHGFQIWEMPVIGFAGYLPFGVECAAVTAWILPSLLERGAEDAQ